MREQRLTHEAGGIGKAELTQKEETLRPGRRRWPAALTKAVTVKAAPGDVPVEATGDRRRRLKVQTAENSEDCSS